MKEKEFVDGQRNLSLPEDNFSTSTPIKTQIKLLEDHYLSTARQPATVWCAINLAPPHARAVCPQIKYGGVVAGPADDSVYGVDVPDEVVEKSKVRSKNGYFFQGNMMLLEGIRSYFSVFVP